VWNHVLSRPQGAAALVEGKESGVAEAERSLVMRDIDRTLLYVGEIDRQFYHEPFAEIVGHPVEHLPARGTGTMPLAIRAMLMDNGVPEGRVPELLADVEGLETAIKEPLS
jgi:hypothetical protein